MEYSGLPHPLLSTPFLLSSLHISLAELGSDQIAVKMDFDHYTTGWI